MFDPPAPARDFIAEYAATWPTVDDPAGAIRTPTGSRRGRRRTSSTATGSCASIQVGELTDAEFERQYALISGPRRVAPAP